ncbi:hypothetical protein BME96_12460 [Virgibacillus halodenitrificans]|uniref:Siphovirus-type tail component RIFT-related domain-containing protein n=1 Tax=Virgibacillus halodenitrificans TaxID=1482 RepID=A0AAC9NLR1_VIRHA|nr:phage tail domain-containing protein [Virgibacillus halodenitrificans]APC48954.1 hypothetical protein BME96_12460 [Virgibacillus halodenitrificans]
MITMDDKYRFEDFGFDCEPGNEDPINPDFEHKTLKIPGRPGLWNFGSEIKEKVFGYNLKIMDRFYEDRQRRFNELVAFLFDDYGQPREIKVVRDYETDKHYIAKLNQSLNPTWDVEEGSLTIVFVAEDSYKKMNVENHEIHWNSETAFYTDSFNMNSTFVDDELITAPTTLETTVHGLAIRPDILIHGSGTNVEISVNGKSFKLKDFTNASFLLRGLDYTCFKNGVENLTEMIGDHPTLLPGNNQIQITGTNMNFKLSIRLRDQFN